MTDKTADETAGEMVGRAAGWVVNCEDVAIDGTVPGMANKPRPDQPRPDADTMREMLRDHSLSVAVGIAKGYGCSMAKLLNLPETPQPPNPKYAWDGSGRMSDGLYPTVSRALLAEGTGMDNTTLSAVLIGKPMWPKTRVAIVIADAAGVTIDQLYADLVNKREQYKQQQKK